MFVPTAAVGRHFVLVLVLRFLPLTKQAKVYRMESAAISIPGNLKEPLPLEESRACKPCSPGTFRSGPCSTELGSTCKACSLCPPGHYVSRPCSPRQDTLCSPCPPYTFSSGLGNQTRCRGCSFCALNQEVTHPCSATQDTVCGGCRKGYYRDPDQVLCRKCSYCHPHVDIHLIRVSQCRHQGLSPKYQCSSGVFVGLGHVDVAGETTQSTATATPSSTPESTTAMRTEFLAVGDVMIIAFAGFSVVLLTTVVIISIIKRQRSCFIKDVPHLESHLTPELFLKTTQIRRLRPDSVERKANRTEVCSQTGAGVGETTPSNADESVPLWQRRQVQKTVEGRDCSLEDPSRDCECTVQRSHPRQEHPADKNAVGGEILEIHGPAAIVCVTDAALSDARRGHRQRSSSESGWSAEARGVGLSPGSSPLASRWSDQSSSSSSSGDHDSGVYSDSEVEEFEEDVRSRRPLICKPGTVEIATPFENVAVSGSLADPKSQDVPSCVLDKQTSARTYGEKVVGSSQGEKSITSIWVRCPAGDLSQKKESATHFMQSAYNKSVVVYL